MNIESGSFRHGAELLRNLPELHELKSVISGIKAANIVAQQQGPFQGKPVGAQKALNQLFKERLIEQRESRARDHPGDLLEDVLACYPLLADRSRLAL
jgi:hypothetical protein